MVGANWTYDEYVHFINEPKFLPGNLKVFDVYALWVGDKNLGGFDEPDSNGISFWMPANWSDNFNVITPTDFNALEDI